MTYGHVMSWLWIGAAVVLMSGCELEKERFPNALGLNRDVIQVHRLYPTGWVTEYNVMLPGPKGYPSRGEYELRFPFTPEKIQAVLQQLRAWTTEAHTVLISWMNQDPFLTYQLGPLHTQVAFKTTLKAPKTRETLTVLSDATVGGQIIYLDPQGKSVPFFFEMTVPESRTVLANPFIKSDPGTEGGTESPALKSVSIPSTKFLMHSSEAWKTAETYLPEPGFKLMGDMAVEGSGQGMQATAQALTFLSTVRLAGVSHHIQFRSEPGLTYQLSTGLQQAQITLTQQAEGSIDLDQTDYRLDQVRLEAGHVIRRPPSFLSKMGLAGSLVYKPTGSAFSLDAHNTLWMKKDSATGQVFKSRNLLSGSLRGKVPSLSGGPAGVEPWLHIDDFSIYLDGGDRLHNGLPEAIHILVEIKGGRVEFGEARITAEGKALRPLTLSLRARALLRLNLAQQTFWSRDNTLMVSVDHLGFEGDYPQMSMSLDPGLQREPAEGGKTLLAALEQYIRRNQTDHIIMISEEALRRLNQDGDRPPIVQALQEQISTLRIEKFDEGRWQALVARSRNLEQDFETSSQVAE